MISEYSISRLFNKRLLKAERLGEGGTQTSGGTILLDFIVLCNSIHNCRFVANSWYLCCAPGGSRTHNLGLRRASLYPLSYWGNFRNYIIYNFTTGRGMAGMAKAIPTNESRRVPTRGSSKNHSIWPVAMARLTSPIALVTSISRGQASVQLKIV